MSVEAPESQQSSQEAVDTNKINEISTKINELAGTRDGNAETQKQLNDLLTENVLNMLTNLDDAAKWKLKDSITLIFESHIGEAWFESANQWFVKLAESLWLKKDEEWVWRENDISTSIEVGKEKYEEWLRSVEKNVTDLLDDVAENDGAAISELLSQKMDSNFYHWLADYFLDNQNGFEYFKTKLLWSWDKMVEKAQQQINGIEDKNVKAEFLGLLNYVNGIKDDFASIKLDVNERENIHKNIDGMIKGKAQSLIELWMEVMRRDISKWSQEAVDNTVELPKFSLNWSLGWIDAWEEWKRDTKLYSDLVRNRPDEWQDDNIEQWKKLYLTTEKIDDQLKKIDDFLKNDKLKDNADIAWIKTFLENAQVVIDNTSENNVRILQQYIYDNLIWQDQTDFESKSRKKGWTFDWRFWVGTLVWLNKVLENTGKYLEDLSSQLSQVEAREDSDQAKLDKVTANPDARVKKGSEVEAKDLVLWAEDWVDVSFVDWNEVTADGVGTQTWKVKLKAWSKEKTLDVTLKVEEGEKPIDNTPLVLGGSQYLLMENSKDIASNAGLDGAMFYFWGLQDPQVEVWEDGKWITKEVPTNGEDYECYMKLSNRPGELYKVKVDALWNLCPIATQIDLQLSNKNGDFMSTEVLISNNNSCKAYLHNKLPNEIKGCGISWNDRVKDYTLKSYWRELTIEPMTIAWEWVSKDLWRSLAFLNLTNYIRNIWDKYGNKDPDIKFDNKGLWIRWLKTPTVPRGKKLVNGFPLNFGLENTNSAELDAFKWYNNHEQWRDNWDRKKANRIYKKL